jgi:ribosomal-protein-alanine N-acetyltransferase
MLARAASLAPNLRLRAGMLADLNALVALECSVFNYDVLSRRSFRRFLNGSGAELIVAEEVAALAGYALVLSRPGSATARLYSIAVAPERAGRGIGPTLLAAAEAAARGRGAGLMRLEVHQANLAAINRYQKAGYRMLGLRAAYYDDGSNALHFEKALYSNADMPSVHDGIGR